MAQNQHTVEELSREDFIENGRMLLEQIADHFDLLREKPVTPGEPPEHVRAVLGTERLPENGSNARKVLKEASDLLFAHSLFAGHPSFWGYIIGSGKPINVLADMLAATVNPNVGGWNLAPMATEIELQVVRWIAEFIGFPSDTGGVLVSGGTMANFVGFLAARRAKAPFEVRSLGLRESPGVMRLYCSAETHTWIQKAADLFGHGTDAIRWIPTDSERKLNTEILRTTIEADIASGDIPFLVIATAGSVSTGVVDDLQEIAEICEQHNLWLHIDGAYGGPAAGLQEMRDVFKGIDKADSIALDPHKWLYSTQEAGCVLVRKVEYLKDTFSYRPPYYHIDESGDEPGLNFYEYGPQNSRGFRALKVWCTFKQMGRQGIEKSDPPRYRHGKQVVRSRR